MPRSVVNAFLDDGGAELVLFERADDGGVKQRRVRAKYVTFHRCDEIPRKTMRLLKQSDRVTHIKEEGSWLQIGWESHQSRIAARYKFTDMGIETFEGDVDPILFHLIESKSEIAKPRRCYLDLEADSRVPLSRKEDMRILSWAVVDHETGEEFLEILEEETDEAERTLLEKLVQLLENYDQVCVWEGDWEGGQFDTVVLPARVRKRGIAFDERRWLFLNQLAVWKRMNQHAAESGAEKESYKLGDIAHQQIGKGKEKAPNFVVKRFGNKPLGAITWDLWEADGKYRRLLGKYNVRDAQILRLLELEKGYIGVFQALAEVCGVIPETRSLRPTRQMDGFLLRLGRSRDHRFSTKQFHNDVEEEEEEKFRGALVIHPKSVPDEDEGYTKVMAAQWRADHGFKNGILRNVHVCDFKSLYPSVMQTWNLSADARVGWADSNDKKIEGSCFSPGTGLLTSTTTIGFIPLALAELIRLRQYWSDLIPTLAPGTPEWQNAKAKSDAYKVAANSFYGAGGSKYSRFNDRDVSEACTQNSVYLLKMTSAEAEKRKMVPVYADTDSVFAIGPTEDGFRKFVGWLNKKKFPVEIASFGCPNNYVSLAFEKTFSRLVFLRAKSYAGRYLQYKGKAAKPDSEPEIKGLAFKRGDRGALARELQGRVIDFAVGGVKIRNKEGEKVPINHDLAGILEEYSSKMEGKVKFGEVELPTENLDVYRAAIVKMKDYVLKGELSIEDVRRSMALKKSIKEYKAKADAGNRKVPAHVQIAQELQSRGHDIGEGVRIEYVVVDGSSSPQRIIPAEDYTGDCDRFYLWEKVYEPTKSFLEAAFPDENWEQYGNVRPSKSRKRGHKVLEGQLAFFTASAERGEPPNDGDLAVPAFSLKPVVIRIPETAGAKAVDRIKKVLDKHPGSRAVEVVIVTSRGEAVLKLPTTRVSTGPRFKEAVDKAIGEPLAAAS